MFKKILLSLISSILLELQKSTRVKCLGLKSPSTYYRETFQLWTRFNSSWLNSSWLNSSWLNSSQLNSSLLNSSWLEYPGQLLTRNLIYLLRPQPITWQRLNNFLFWTFRFGAIDANLASKHSFPSLNFAAVAGPTHDQHPPFSWDQVPYNRPYFMPINTFYFHPFNQKWVLNSLNSSKFDKNIAPQYARINETWFGL